MTTVSEFIQQIQSYFTTEFASTGVEIAYDNVAFERTVDEFVRLTIEPADYELNTIGAPGARQYATSFLITVQIFTAPDSGRARNDELIQKVMEIFTDSDLGIFIIPFGINSTELEDEAYYQNNVRFECKHYATM